MKLISHIQTISARTIKVILIGLIVIGMLAPLRHASALTTNATPAAKVSFTFDDGLTSALTQAAPVLSAHGLVGTDYVITGCVGMSAVPNKCLADNNRSYMTWAQIQALQNSYSWEIGSHTVDHKCLASNSKQDPDDCQKKALTTAQVDAELVNSKAALATNGINATDLAPPYGDFSNSVLTEIAKYYGSMRQFKNAAGNANVWPYSDYYLQNYPVEETTDTVASIETRIDNAIANKQWLILTFHDIQPAPSTDPMEYQFSTTELDQVAAYVQAKQQAGAVQNVRVDHGLVTSDVNMLTNGSFNSGLSAGWRTNAPAAFTSDSGSHGSYPDPLNSIKISSATNSSGHLFSPVVAVDPNTTYMFKSFLNVSTITSGLIGYYVDEYDVNGNWISGQYLKQETSSFVESMNFTYKPSSNAVKNASLQVIMSGSGITAYIDNVQMFPLTMATPPVRTNLVANGTFDNGIASGWHTDAPTTITADSSKNGSPSNPVNSVKLVSAASNTHLFSPLVNVSSGHTYELDSYLNLQQISGSGSEVGYYVDEYDSAGNWISGQYKLGVYTLGAKTVSLQYAPSSSSVAKASLQIIVTGNSNIVAYLDDIQWYSN